MNGIIHSVIYDCADIKASAAFYAQLTGFKEASVDDDWITLRGDDGIRLCFQLAPDHVPPRWPSQEFPQQFHLDFLTPDLAGETARAISLGATRLEGGGGETWTVLADPSGHPLCLCASDDAKGLVLQEVSIDCPDGKALGDFYAAVLGYEMTYDGPEGSFITADGALPLMFQNVVGYKAPRWPDPAYPQQAHLDIAVEEIEVASAEVLALGATPLPGGGGVESGYRVFADPAGHPFCLVWGQ